jgi:hypothetical protein
LSASAAETSTDHVGRAHVGRAHGALPKPLAALPAGFTMLETWTADRVPATMRRLERSVTPRDRAEVDSCSRSEWTWLSTVLTQWR